MDKLTDEEHKARHVALHRSLDELVADWIRHTGRSLVIASVMDLMTWSAHETVSPTPTPED